MKEAQAGNERVDTILAELRRRFQDLYGDRLVKMVLYGSQARGDARRDSDIDVLVVLKGPVRAYTEIERTGNIVADLSLASGQVISCLFMDEERFTRRGGPLLTNIRREGVAV